MGREVNWMDEKVKELRGVISDIGGVVNEGIICALADVVTEWEKMKEYVVGLEEGGKKNND